MDRELLYKTGTIISPEKEKYKQYDRVVDIDVSDVYDMQGINTACCVTVYNEDGSALLVSLLGLIKNAQYIAKLRGCTAGHEIVVCIIVDGVNSMSNSFFEYSKECGFLDDRCLEEQDDIHVYQNYSDGSDLNKILQEQLQSDFVSNSWLRSNEKYINDIIDNKSHHLDEDLKVRVIYYIKKENSGKLDSHWHFFEVICPFLNPKYCVQMDLGTNPMPEAVFQMHKEINRKKNIAAVAARSYIPKPENPLNLSNVWQYTDMIKERVMLWPTEVLFGYLSVMPGQLCMMRWAAVDSRRASAITSKPVEDVTVIQSDTLAKYYRGLDDNPPLESNMFLAEDRILGFEIASDEKKRWKIDYAPNSIATTDACDTWKELLNQRRRWICGAFSCKLWLLMKVGAYFNNSDKKKRDKLSMFLSAMYFVFDMLQNWLSIGLIALSFVFMKNIALSSVAEVGIHSYIINILFYTVILSVLVQVYIALNKLLKPWVETFLNFSVFLQSASLLYYSCLAVIYLVASEEKNIIVVLSPILYLLFLFNVFLYFGKSTMKMLPYTLIYSIISPSISFFMHLFAFCNADDVSWGTKGLIDPKLKNETTLEEQKSRSKSFSNFKWIVVFAFFISNGIFYVLTDMYVENELNYIVFVLKISLFSTFLSLIGFVAINFRSFSDEIEEEEVEVGYDLFEEQD